MSIGWALSDGVLGGVSGTTVEPFPVCLEEANLLLPQSDLHENAHEVVQFTDYFGAQVCS